MRIDHHMLYKQALSKTKIDPKVATKEIRNNKFYNQHLKKE